MTEKKVVEEEKVVNHRFALVHGAWCWYKMRSLMESKGYKVTCLDLKGAGINQADPDTIFTLKDYNEPLIKFMSNLPENKKVILMGHSAGGMSLTDTIYRFGKMGSIQMVIYVAATMLKHRFSTDQNVQDVRTITFTITYAIFVVMILMGTSIFFFIFFLGFACGVGPSLISAWKSHGSYMRANIMTSRKNKYKA